jgi:K+-transporting ATPase KdpF subunit
VQICIVQKWNDMKTAFLMFLTVQPAVATTSIVAGINLRGYFLGAIIAMILLGYLVYSLIKPEKF